MFPRFPPFLPALVLLLAAWIVPAPPAHAADPTVTWDADLARPADREDYERRLVAIVKDARARVAAGLGIEPPATLAVKVHSRAGFERAFGGRAGEREAARMTGDVVHLNGGSRLDARLAGLLVHEMTHATLDARGTAAALPLWVDEGLADRLSWELRGQAEPAPSQLAELRQARDRGTLLPLPTAGELTPAQYLASWSAVVFLERRIGRERFLSAVRAALGGEPFEKALRRESGLSLDEAERAFERWVGSP